ncbi:MAG: hypothetical protein COA78_27760 [Blastopirellula sp.]|nr:MAG: hypothetical protein COA78_27760 [Blastopirellula sp.]
MRYLLTFLFVLITSMTALVADELGSSRQHFSEEIKPFLQKHCVECHGLELQESQIRFDQLIEYQVENQVLWTKVYEAITSSKMPPEDYAQPSQKELNNLSTWIVNQQRTNNSGKTRRLNRRELAAALRDLTGLSIDYERALPEDGKVDGFDTGAEGLQDAGDSLNQIMRVTRQAVDGIRFLEPTASQVFTANLRDSKDPRKTLDQWNKEGAYAKIRGYGIPEKGLLIEPKWINDRGGQTFAVVPKHTNSNILRLKISVSATKNHDTVPNPHLWIDVGAQVFDYHEIPCNTKSPVLLTYEIQTDDLPLGKRGLDITLINKVEVPYRVKGFENDDRSKPEDKLPSGTGLFRPIYDKKQLSPEEHPVPYLVLENLEIENGYVAAWPPVHWNTELGVLADNTESAKKLLHLWMNRAYRRPVTESEKKPYLEFYESLRKQGLSFDNALRAAFQSVLLSGPFRYLISPSESEASIAQYAIASRLSFMLTGSPPDSELQRLANADQLRNNFVLNNQVDRLLRDTRSKAFFQPFVTQWLEIGQPITITSESIKMQDFRFIRYLKASMRAETVAYVSQLITENRPARELITSDWAMMNDILAIHYEYDEIEGGHLRKVKLRKHDPRGGGILGHAGIQSMLCWMGDNWVIYRGAWTLRAILDDPLPPPPLEVPDLDPSAGENRGKTFKELLVQHQENAKCSVCHKDMDPLGFAFQNFDISGRWRDVEFERYVKNDLDGKIEWYGTGKTRPVDNIGRLPRGENFSSFSECKQLLAEHYQQDIVRGFMKKLVLYSTGRKPDVEDMLEIQSIMEQHADAGYPFRDMLKAWIQSQAFLD